MLIFSIARLWAQANIEHWQGRLQLGLIDAEQARAHIVPVALHHHLVTPYTSLVAVDITPARPTDVPGAEQDRATSLAQASLAGLPKTATGGQLHLLIGLAAFMFAALLWVYRRAEA